MNLFFRTFILLYAIYLSDAGYYGAPGVEHPQSDVEAPAYLPQYAKPRPYGTKSSYSGVKTSHRYSGAINGYSGTKTFTRTKTHYTKTSGGMNAKHILPASYGEHRTWQNTGSRPTYNDFQHNAKAPYDRELCDVDCENNGICTDRNTCLCPPNFTGKLCEIEKKACLDFPPLPMNSGRNCTAELCITKCKEGHKFFDGTSVAQEQCVDGQWRPTRADLTSLSDCQPQCDPPCEHGGVCLSVNTCQCPIDYKGPQCQYAATACDVRKLAFNGGYNCSVDAEKTSCKLSCPRDASFSTPSSGLYTCLFSTGVFEPQPIPHCVFDNVFVITPSHSHGHGHYPKTEPAHETIVVQNPTPKEGSCLNWGGVHHKTFDGKIYSFQSPCTFTLVRDALEHKYTVALSTPDCPRPHCPSEITIYLEDKTYKLSLDGDGSVVFQNMKRMIPIPATLPNIQVSMPSDQVIVNLDVGLTLKWDTNNLVIVEASVLLWNKTEGLCGTLDGNPDNDMITKEGIPAVTKALMVSSWELNKINKVCDSSPQETSACKSESGHHNMKKALHFCTSVFRKDKFRKCSKVMDVTQLLETCQWDYCACAASLNPEECACRTVAVYASECLRHGVQEMVSWRDSETCPMKCPEGKIYKACGSDRQPSCAFPEIPVAENNKCVEGCYCPDGMFLEGGKCVQKSACPCRIRSKLYAPGSVVPKNCNTCTCSDGSWVCSMAACGARCGAVGDPHYTTFDGTRFDFMGHCTYTLLSAPNVTVVVENVACSGTISEDMNLTPYKGEGRPSCTKAVSVTYGGTRLRLQQGGTILVNGDVLATLPVTVGGIRIRTASSLFIIVQLPIKVDLWWDGNTRVFVDVPPSFKDQTKGLCGTFNLNQKDDFLTPEGDVEQSALAFANKWKTREFCEDINVKEPEHPCSANIENKDTAEKYCSKLKGNLFESCHAFVDVQSYYEACLYDVCACAGDVSRCMCPVLGDYAMACAEAGVHVQWRYHVKHCEVSCDGGQQYMVCADSCERTCADVARGECHPRCVEGCACPRGQVLDNNNVCVPVAMCSCYHMGMEFKPNYKEVRPALRGHELCTCVGARWECVLATDVDIHKYPPTADLRANCSAAEHRELTACEYAEPLTCKNMHIPQTVTSHECRPGCQCKHGYVLDSSTNKCVLATECPCHHGGRSYPDGHIMQEECNTCKCESGMWTCGTRPCAGVCGAWGDSHVTTFDGETFDFQGVCTYLLAKGTIDGKDGFSVEIQNTPCGTTGATCSKSVTLKVSKDGDEESVSLTKSSPLPDTSDLKKIKLRIAGAYLFLDVPSLGMSLQWDRELRVYVKIESMWKNRVKGLCGNFNSDTRDDFQTPSGGGFSETSALIFADSWKLQPTCPKAHEVTDHCKERPQRVEWAAATCGALKRAPFSSCAAEVPPGPFAQRCEADACACDSGADCDCACAALAAYAHACSLRGVYLRWRTQDLCPMQCDEECSTYNECMSPCPAETCDNTLDYAEIKTVCAKDTCVEGCKPNKTCPEGSVYSNSTLQECVPRAKCKPVCMTLPEGKVILEGEIIEQDACHTCHCSKKHRVCTGQPCSTRIPEITSAASESTSAAPEETSEKTGTASSEQKSTSMLPEKTSEKTWTPSAAYESTSVAPEITSEKTGNPTATPESKSVAPEKTSEKTETTSAAPVSTSAVPVNKPFQCLDPLHPNHPHPSNCNQFYECTPELGTVKAHAVLKSCAPGLMYNPVLMVCDWPSSVLEVRPECQDDTMITSDTTDLDWITDTTELDWITVIDLCPDGQTYSDCAHECDQLCEHFARELKAAGRCINGEKCVEGCVPQNCSEGKRWRDNLTCVPLRDCTCDDHGRIVKPGEVLVTGCKKCQCLDNALHCDTSECEPREQTYQPRILPTPTGMDMEFTSEPPSVPTTEDTTIMASTESTTRKAATTVAPTTLLIKTTVSPPPECSTERYKYLLWGDQPLVGTSFTASSVASPMFEPQFAVLNGTGSSVSAGSWNPVTSNTQQFLEVRLPSREPLYGLVLQGSPLFEQFVTSYDIMYGDDGNVFHTVNAPDGKPQVFRGPVDNKIPMKQMIEPAIEAKFVRIHPLTWHDDIAIRLELIGCSEPSTTDIPETSTTSKPMYTSPTASPEVTVPTTLEPMQCTEPLGLGAELPLEMVTVSSNIDARAGLRLASPRGWAPAYSTPGEWIMFNFTSPRNITGIKTKGGANGWVSAYNVMYTCDLKTFNPVLDASGNPRPFPANFDKDEVVMNEFHPPLHAQFLKVLPIKWAENIEMHVEPIGCFEPYPELTTPAPTPSACSLCPSVPAAACSCAAPLHYNGESCVPRDQCPCVIGYMTYEVGASFRGVECDECICKIGGVSDCRPAKTCECAPDLVPNLTKDCKCLCEPCTNGTKICPSSKLCLPLEKWCDGLQDCPDDESSCGTTVVETVRTTVVPKLDRTPPHTTTPTTTLATTTAPHVCPKVECPPGYIVRYSSLRRSYSSSELLPPPRPKNSYQRYYKGGSTRVGAGSSKGGFSKGRSTKGGYRGLPPPRNQAFSLEKPSLHSKSPSKEVCPQYHCVPKWPPVHGGTTPRPGDCLTPVCPRGYSLKLETTPDTFTFCPQYMCVPPPERPVFCNMTGRTFTTFDGMEYKYDVCNHILARENRLGSWTVLVRKNCRPDGCTNELLLHQGDQMIIVKPSMIIEYNNYEYTVEQATKICFQKNSFDVAHLGSGLAIRSRIYNFTVLFSKDGDVKVGVYSDSRGHVDGLCGAFDGDASNDRKLPNGTAVSSTEQFAHSWAKPGLAPDACRRPPCALDQQTRVLDMCKVIDQEPLSRCGKVLNLDKWRTICLEKICQCTDAVVNGSKKTEAECRCALIEQLVGECLAADKDIDVSGWRVQMDCPADCPAPLVHYDCYRRRCEPACGDAAAGGSARNCPAEDGHCFPGCYCPEGKLRQGDKCIVPSDCLDCSCTGVGTPAKYVTFEGDDLPFLGNCTYLASRDRNGVGKHKFEVYATNGPCEDNGAIVCTKVVHLIHGGNVVHISKAEDGQKLSAVVNGEAIFMYPKTNDWATISLLNGQDVSVLLPELHVELIVFQAKLEFNVRVPSHLYANRTEGLCGVCAGYLPHLVASNGSVTDDVELYGKSWQASPESLSTLEVPPREQCGELPLEPECVVPPPEKNPCYHINNAEKFGQCHALIEPYFDECQAELCLNRSECGVLERYAADCARQGVCLDWRGTLCPLPCEAPFVYHSCMDCERTCENYDELKDNKKCNKNPVEGCFCPEGKVKVNNTCIEPNKCFPCDANKEHYAGDEWQEDACTKCSCSKTSDGQAHVACTTQTCSRPVCAHDHEVYTMAPAQGACCPTYHCVLKPPNERCKTPPKMECAFGQVLKQKTKDGCPEFACECMPESECEHIPTTSEVEMLEPGMERVIDRSGCCPRARLECRREMCPKAPECPRFHELRTDNNTAQCCPEYHCDAPKNKCIVRQEWEAASIGGEKRRSTPLEMLKNTEDVWLDGPCRTCRCVALPLGAVPQCSVVECPAVVSNEQFLLEPRPVPFSCCPEPVHVACRDGDNIYKVGENWTSSDSPCESYRCAETDQDRLEKITNVLKCDDCQQGFTYVESTDKAVCCGRCEPVACVVHGETHLIGDTWRSADFCTNYTCLNLNGTLQVQSSDESCPEVSEALMKQFVLSDEKTPGKCCAKKEPIACRVGNKIYQENQTWTTDSPCVNVTCARDETGRLTQLAAREACPHDCPRGWRLLPPTPHVCCGRCEEHQCVNGDELRDIGTTWKSDDNCTTFTCERFEGDVYVTSAMPTCPDVSACAPENLVNETCCQTCKPESHNQIRPSPCEPVAFSKAETVALLERYTVANGLCTTEGLENFKECRGTCDTGTLYNSKLRQHETKCECCQATKYESLDYELVCANNSTMKHRVESPVSCACRSCAASASSWFENGLGKPPTKNGFSSYPDYIAARDSRKHGRIGGPIRPAAPA